MVSNIINVISGKKKTIKSRNKTYLPSHQKFPLPFNFYYRFKTKFDTLSVMISDPWESEHNDWIIQVILAHL